MIGDVQDNKNSILEELFLREKPAKILLGMKISKGGSVYATLLSKSADCTYSHTIKILNAFNRLGIVQFEKTGRIKKVNLTNDGWDIAHNLEAMIKKFEQIESEVTEEKPEKKTEAKPSKKRKRLQL
jgi:predicted transcriptional regulator